MIAFLIFFSLLYLAIQGIILVLPYVLGAAALTLPFIILWALIGAIFGGVEEILSMMPKKFETVYKYILGVGAFYLLIIVLI